MTMTAAALLLAGATSSCNTTEKSPYPGYEKTANGLYYKFHEKHEGETPKVGDLMEIGIHCTVNDTVDIIPNMKNMMMLSVPLFAGDIFDGLAMMHKGDSASFIVNIDSTFIKMYRQPSLPEEFKPTDILRYDIKMNDFFPEIVYLQRMAVDMQARNAERIAGMKDSYPEETAKAAKALETYMQKNGIVAEPTESGLCYVITEEGSGEKPEVGRKVKVHYTGKLLDGTVFDSSIERGEPIEFPLGIGQVIPGWDEGIGLMRKGEKGVLYIPYYLAYGERGAGEMIPPFSNLMFEVELVDFE